MNERDREKAYEFFRRWLAEADADTGKDLTYIILADFTVTFEIPWNWVIKIGLETRRPRYDEISGPA